MMKRTATRAQLSLDTRGILPHTLNTHLNLH